MTPFAYPPQAHVRRHGPQGYARHESFRPWLRDEFSFRCVYCLRREQWDRAIKLEVEHFQPTSRTPQERLNYDNLVYACARCNAAKAARSVPDATQVFLDGSVTVQPDGQIIGHSPDACRLISDLRLNSAEAIHFRRLWLEIVAMAYRFVPDLYHRLMGYPDDLPDLSRMRPPNGNTRPAGVSQSHFARRERGELPTTY